ncbi:MAG: LacI family DNA-binding transcriptional regulator [Kangiellaceae bacterium]|nr:LacI family DNA-binding transcriptional regulator [Kangiellaceae bacterium]
MPKEKKVKLTLKSVAGILNVSNATVSNAFNRPDQLSEKKREEILKACKELGYAGPNQAARSLRKGRSGIVGLVLSDSPKYVMSDPVANLFLQGVTEFLEQKSVNLLLISGNQPSLKSVVDFVDGFICYGAPRNTQLIEELSDADKRVVTVDFNIEGRSSVNIDNEQAAYQIASSVIDDAEQTTAILGLRLIDSKYTCRVHDNELIGVQHSIAHRRLDGYLRRINEVGGEITGEHIWSIPESSHLFAKDAAREALNSKIRPDVFLCMSDIIALAAMKEVLQMGLRVPEDIKIVGFDGINEGVRFHPSLTTVEQFSSQKGLKAAELFFEDSPESNITPFKIEIRESSQIQ